MTSPMYSSGISMSILTMGSSSVGLHCSTPFLNPMEPAILKAISDESTVWKDPSKSETRTSTTG